MGAEATGSKETILVVDDAPFNITLLSNILKPRFHVIAAPNGETALKILDSPNLPDLILLDIIMPGMDGYEVCKALKANPKTAEIPILFTSSLSETPDIVKGFHVGGVDYITKPFQPEEVFARVEVHLALKRAKAEIQSVLSKTLVGSIRLMIETLTITQPQLVKQSNRIRRYAKDILKRLALDPQDSWSIELATMLSHIGCISMPDTVMKKMLMGKRLEPDELERYQQYPALGAKLLENIPRLEKTVEMVRNQLVSPAELNFKPDQVEYTGSVLLNMLISFDLLVNNGFEEGFALIKVKQQIKGLPENLIDALQEVVREHGKSPEKRIPVNDIKPGMILAEDVFLKDGNLLLSKGTEFSANLIDLVQRFVFQELCSMRSILISHR